ncbi:hypothetical protein EXIGLDRAFT_453561 [Exidia glandulosa HHB12029]|uniref:Uncharacterized protein n=1 Tax=Exidia glandulosa HHB12029 TaxID=1314781 RepID=A0A165B2S0_EXIGL|nr:hypothetical protein EXIGLDRAFT_453561 [Exidia glandulosa HHB12029]
MSCQNARLNFATISSHSLRLAKQFPVLSRLVIGITDDALPELGLREGDIVFPSSISSLCVQAFDERNTAELLHVTQKSIKRIRTLEVELFSLECEDLDWLSLFTDLAPPLRLRIGPPEAVSHPLRPFCVIPSNMALTVESSDGYIRTIRLTDDEFCGPDDCDNGTYWEQFEQFSRLRPLRAAVQDVTVVHAFLPVVFALEELPALRCLDIDLDELSGPFWMTEATEDANDYAGGDRTPPERPTSFPRQHFAGQLHAKDEAGFDGIPISHSVWERNVTDCALLNVFDEAEEEYMLQCPALETVVLRTSHSQTRVSTRQLAHFGRALGLLDRAEGNRPRLRLLGVGLSSAKYGRLHLRVFDEVEQVL